MGTGLITGTPILSKADLDAVKAEVTYLESVALPTLPDRVPKEGTEERDIYDRRLRFIMSVKIPLERLKAEVKKEEKAITAFSIKEVKE